LDKTLAAGDTITQTQSALVLETLISQFLFSKAADPGASSVPPAGRAVK
jgi:phospholipid/cholesterol/gamma-HCH transport system substrate-binding protein